MKKKLISILSLALVSVLGFSIALPASAATQVKRVTGLQSYKLDDDEINLKWKRVPGADVYQIYVYKSGEWKYVDGTKKLHCEIEDLASSKQYKFKVRAYKRVGSKKLYGPFSSVLSTATEPDEVENERVSSKTKTTVTLKWSEEKRATGYQVYVYSSSKGKYVKKASVKTNSATIKGLKANRTYKFKVRAYFKANGDVYYGEFSDTITVKTNKAASSSSSELISSSKATSIALKNAGLSKNQVRNFSCEYDVDDGVRLYEIEFEYGKYEYSYEISAKTGKILERERERD